MTKARATGTTGGAKGALVVGTGSTTAAPLTVGTDGQVLTAASGQTTGLQWGTPTDATKVPLSTVTAAGDLIVATGSGAVTNLAAGTSGYALTANGAGAAPTYQAIPTGSLTQIASGSLSGAQLNITGISQSYKGFVFSSQAYSCTATAQVSIQVNGDTGTNYAVVNIGWNSGSSVASSNNNSIITGLTSASGSGSTLWAYFSMYSSTAIWKPMTFYGSTAGGPVQVGNATWKSTSAITSLQFQNVGGGTFNGGTYTLYGVN